MQRSTRLTLIIVFWLLCITDIIAIISPINLLHYIVKPLLVPVLIVSLFLTATNVPGKMLIIAGLFFSWAGDIFLLFESRQKLFFIFGLVCFLTTHVLYITYFLRIRSTNISLLKKQPVLLLLVIGYGTALVWFLFPHLGDLKIPVLVYATVICTMLLCSLHAYLKLNKTAANAYLLGAAAFVLSDSLLAINKFYQPFAYAGAGIMLTYCAAQYFIVKGFVKQDARS